MEKLDQALVVLGNDQALLLGGLKLYGSEFYDSENDVSVARTIIS